MEGVSASLLQVVLIFKVKRLFKEHIYLGTKQIESFEGASKERSSRLFISVKI